MDEDAILGELLGDIYEDEDFMYGYDDDYDEDPLGDLLGYRGRRSRGGRSRGSRGRRGRRRQLTPSRQREVASRSPLVSQIPGVPATAAKMIPLGFGRFVFTVSTATSNTFTANPQVPLRPWRPVIIVNRDAGASGIAVTVDDIQVGTRSQFAGSGGVPADVFQANAQNVFLKGDAAQPGITITIQVTLSAAPTGTDTVTVSAAIICEAVS